MAVIFGLEVIALKPVIFDAGPLITTCKFGVDGRWIIDCILDHCAVVIATSVYDEVVLAGVRYPDAQRARQRIDRGQIEVVSPLSEPALSTILALYALGQGECDSISLTQHPTLLTATLVLDDHLAYLVSDRLGYRQRFLLDLIVDLVDEGELALSMAQAIVREICSRYPLAFVEHTLFMLQR
ncbi:MAG: hypothetical protein JXA33_29150 [Anaerolineae bacterium]|nr:hypothetical protein [Anaerolineae bacterium]